MAKRSPHDYTVEGTKDYKFATIPAMRGVAYNSSLFYNSKEKLPG